MTKEYVLNDTLPQTYAHIVLAALEFFYFFCLEDESNQDEVFAHLDLLLEATHPLRSRCDQETRVKCVGILSKFLSQSRNMSLKLSVTQIRRMLEFSGGLREEYIGLLGSIVKYDGEPLTRNQNIVLKLLVERKDIYVQESAMLHSLVKEKTASTGPLDLVFRCYLTIYGEETVTKITSFGGEEEEDQEASSIYYIELFRLLASCYDVKNRPTQLVRKHFDEYIDLQKLFHIESAIDYFDKQSDS